MKSTDSPATAPVKCDVATGGSTRCAIDSTSTAVLVAGPTGPLETSVQYFTNWPAQVQSYALLGGGEPTTLWVRLWNHLPDAERIAVSEEILYGGDTPAGACRGGGRATGAAPCPPHRCRWCRPSPRGRAPDRAKSPNRACRSLGRVPGTAVGEERRGDGLYVDRLAHERCCGGSPRRSTRAGTPGVGDGQGDRERVPGPRRDQPHPLHDVDPDGRADDLGSSPAGSRTGASQPAMWWSPR